MELIVVTMLEAATPAGMNVGVAGFAGKGFAARMGAVRIPPSP